ncbi:glucose-6-phosphate isomerase [Arcanobacterium pluranimalium]|uniref:glucose-6-phosphate isomerase n=1 Tax=Arcanobacterium pluranimalium TaxID=108028 RepID=UPI00195CFDD1|nr:glucose-6-phosphate isomerase [Arcanobacterium pluranimalium]MBM7825053.1 glucose-6-phosphate isomerase [Arcanobacterium pluranimalium]
MAMPIDATQTPAWAKLAKLRDELRVDFRTWFETDPERAQRHSHQAGELFVDLSKSYITDEIKEALLELARDVQLSERRDAMFAGEKINVTEGRSVLHTALRQPEGNSVFVDGVDVVPGVHEVLARIFDFADRVRSGQWRGISGKRITTVVNIGIGGSDLGPVMAYEALKPYVQDGLECRFISNIDPTDLGEKLRGVDPETVLFIVASKTFTTLETLTNARQARAWLLEELQAAGIDSEGAVAKHFVAVSTNLEKVAEFGIDPLNAFGFWDWVGGRYSVDSAVGTSLAIAIGSQGFADFLGGFNTMDEHFKNAAPEDNVPLLMGLLNIFYCNFLGAATHAVLPYAQYLHRFPAYLQQLTMESNGKRVRWDGTDVTTTTGEVFWGEPGTNGQHAFYQLIHQGTQLIPADFIAFSNPTYALKDGEFDQHELFLGNFFGQTKALAFGKTEEEVRAEGTREEIVSARVFPGNKPTTSIMAPALTPAVLGQLIALYEHITFVQGIVWGIDSFDQWGVELGKQMANQLTAAVAGDEAEIAKQDPSTRALINFYRDTRF